MTVTAMELEAALAKEMEDTVSGTGGASVVDVSTGALIFGHDHNTERLMASTTKLFTAGAALEVLGSKATVRTRLVTDRPPENDGTLDGDLYIIGGGDPTLGSSEHVQATYQGEGTSVWRIVEQVRAAGIRAIRGRVIGDGSLFEDESGFSGRVAALTYNRARQERPVLHAAEMITNVLKQDGISVSQPAAEGVADPTRMHPVGSVESPSMLSLLTRSGHDSDNFIAETVSKLIAASEGKKASTRLGAALIQQNARDHGANIEIANGSGLGVANLSSPSATTDFLVSLNRTQYRSDFVEALPQAGKHGTLRFRMRNTLAGETVRAKTGTLSRNKQPVQDSLAGYVFGRQRTVAFSLVREGAESRYAARASIDRMAGLLAHHCD